jgi:hypothetical protein
VISFPFNGFVEDIRKTAEDGRIKVFMEQKEVEVEKLRERHEEEEY